MNGDLIGQLFDCCQEGKMKLEDIDDVLKQNVSKDCCVRLLAARILHCDDYSKLYESCRNYDEFEKGS